MNNVLKTSTCHLLKVFIKGVAFAPNEFLLFDGCVGVRRVDETRPGNVPIHSNRYLARSVSKLNAFMSNNPIKPAGDTTIP